VQYCNYRSSRITNNERCPGEITSSIATAATAFNKKKKPEVYSRNAFRYKESAIILKRSLITAIQFPLQLLTVLSSHVHDVSLVCNTETVVTCVTVALCLSVLLESRCTVPPTADICMQLPCRHKPWQLLHCNTQSGLQSPTVSAFVNCNVSSPAMKIVHYHSRCTGRDIRCIVGNGCAGTVAGGCERLGDWLTKQLTNQPAS
jgi:hypothetical protein